MPLRPDSLSVRVRAAVSTEPADRFALGAASRSALGRMLSCFRALLHARPSSPLSPVVGFELPAGGVDCCGASGQPPAACYPACPAWPRARRTASLSGRSASLTRV